MPVLIDITGKVFGKWKVLHRVAGDAWLCKCACGTVKEVSSAHLRNGRSRSCHSCAPKAVKHGQSASDTRKYRAWQAMKNRCTNPNGKDYARYSTLGMCSEWLEFSVFAEAIPDPPTEQHTLERLDTTKGYFPGNVGWVTQSEQTRNRLGNVWVEFDGVKLLQSDWAKLLKTDASTLRRQIASFGIEAAFVKYGVSSNVDLYLHPMLDTNSPSDPKPMGCAGTSEVTASASARCAATETTMSP